jgi:hypothetical protein
MPPFMPNKYLPTVLSLQLDCQVSAARNLQNNDIIGSRGFRFPRTGSLICRFGQKYDLDGFLLSRKSKALFPLRQGESM